MKRFLIAFFYLLVFPVLLYAQRDVELVTIKLFESGFDPPPQDDRYYSTSFNKDDARYIFYEIQLDNNLYDIRDNDLKIQAKYYYPSGSLMSDPVLRKTMPYEWKTGYYWHGWGWDELGNWPPGTYTVEVYIDNIFVADGQFTIFDDEETISSISFIASSEESDVFTVVGTIKGTYELKPSSVKLHINEGTFYINNNKKFSSANVKSIRIGLGYYTDNNGNWNILNISKEKYINISLLKGESHNIQPMNFNISKLGVEDISKCWLVFRIESANGGYWYIHSESNIIKN